MNEREIIVNGILYTAQPPGSPLAARDRGFYGRRFTIAFRDGQIAHTDDLRWCVAVPREDTAVILSGWIRRSEIPSMGWRETGHGSVYGPLREIRAEDDERTKFNGNAGCRRKASRRREVA